MTDYVTDAECRRILHQLQNEHLAMKTVLEYCYGQRNVNDPVLKVAVQEHKRTAEVLNGYQ